MHHPRRQSWPPPSTRHVRSSSGDFAAGTLSSRSGRACPWGGAPTLVEKPCWPLNEIACGPSRNPNSSMIHGTAYNLMHHHERRLRGLKLLKPLQNPRKTLVPLAGIEPALLAELDFESSASTNSATGALCRRRDYTEQSNAVNRSYWLYCKSERIGRVAYGRVSRGPLQHLP
jgi:hypothetical protein